MNSQGSGISSNTQALHSYRHMKGFTLLEVLLATAILAGILTVIYASFAMASRNVEQAESIRGRTDLARTLLSRLADDIHNASCMYSVAGRTVSVFYGKKQELDSGEQKRRNDSIALTTLTNWRKPDSKEMDLWEVGYFFREKTDGSGQVLMRREKRDLSANLPPLEGGTEYEVSDRVAELRLRYYNGASWVDEWGSATSCSYPKAVELVMILDDGSLYTTRVDVGAVR